MKLVNKICQIAAIVFFFSALVLFFLPFVKVTAATGEYNFIASELAFGTKLEGLDKLAQSAHIWFCFFLTLASLALASFTFKFKKARYWAAGIGLVDAIYMLVIILSRPGLFVDTRPLILTAKTEYTLFAVLLVAALFVATAFSICHLFIDDKIMVSENKGKKTILQRLVQFIRDYKSEVKKIVWPGLNEVVKNTLIVLIICGIIGAFIWVLDFGLAQLLELVTKTRGA